MQLSSYDAENIVVFSYSQQMWLLKDKLYFRSGFLLSIQGCALTLGFIEPITSLGEGDGWARVANGHPIFLFIFFY